LKSELAERNMEDWSILTLCTACVTDNITLVDLGTRHGSYCSAARSVTNCPEPACECDNNVAVSSMNGM